MDELDRRVVLAQSDSAEADKLLGEYLPLIKRQVLETIGRGADYEDMLSTGMLAFANAVKQYQPQRGSFVPFARLCIRSRVLDELRRSGKRAATVSLDTAPDGGADPPSAVVDASLAVYSRERERQALSEEIAALRQALQGHGIPFDSLAAISPKQKRSKSLCISAARHVTADAEMRKSFEKDARLAQARLAQELGVSPKTIEQHRRYIVTLVIILLGDYPCIRAFLPALGEVNA